MHRDCDGRLRCIFNAPYVSAIRLDLPTAATTAAPATAAALRPAHHLVMGAAHAAFAAAGLPPLAPGGPPALRWADAP